MFFFGREKEIKTLRTVLEQGKSIVLTGKFGIGKTALIQHLSEITQDRWWFIFADFSRSANSVCQDILKELFPHRTTKSLPYKSARFKILNERLKDHRKPILVLDNFGKVSVPKLDFIRRLSSSRRFLLILIVEHFVPKHDILNLRGVLFPSDIITLRPLTLAESSLFFRCCSDKYRLRWDESRIESSAVATHGYPLLIREVVEREIRHSSKTKDSC